jgi:hypothetical protein
VRHSLRILFGFVALSISAVASEITIVRTLANWRDAASFKRVSEYFTGRENPGDSTILRTDPAQRSGYYFLVRVNNAGPTTATSVTLQIISPTESAVKLHTFQTTLSSGKNVFNFGLTGTDWTDPEANPVAWKIDFLAPDGRTLVSSQSYLWEKPVSP